MQFKIDNNGPIDFLNWLEEFQTLLNHDEFVYKSIDNNSLWRNLDSVYKVKSLKWRKKSSFTNDFFDFSIPENMAQSGNSLDSISVWNSDPNIHCFSLEEFAEILLHNMLDGKPISLVLTMQYFQDCNLKITKKLNLPMRVVKDVDNLLMSRYDQPIALLTTENLPLNHIVRKTKFNQIAPKQNDYQYLDLLNQQIQKQDRVVLTKGSRLVIGQVQSCENGIITISCGQNQNSQTIKIKNSNNLLVINDSTQDCLLEYILSN